MLRGRCRHCGASIGRRMPFAEIAGGLLASLLWAALGPTAYFALAALAACGGMLALIVAIERRELDRGVRRRSVTQ